MKTIFSKRLLGDLFILAAIAVFVLYAAFGSNRVVAFFPSFSEPFSFFFYVFAMFYREAWLFPVFALLIVVGIAIRQSPQQGTPPALPKPFRVIDVIYFLTAVPLILAVAHETLVCTFVPGLGMHAGDTSGCTLGWGVLGLIPFMAVWMLLSVTALPVRLLGLRKLGKQGLVMFVALALSALIPLVLIVPLFL